LRNGGVEILGTDDAIRKELLDVLTRAAGEEGKTKKANAVKIGQMMKSALAEGGSAHTALLKFDEHL